MAKIYVLAMILGVLFKSCVNSYVDPVDDLDLSEELKPQSSYGSARYSHRGHGGHGSHDEYGNQDEGGEYTDHGAKEEYVDDEHHQNYKGSAGYDGHNSKEEEEKKSVQEEHSFAEDFDDYKKYNDEHSAHGEKHKHGGDKYKYDDEQNGHQGFSAGGEEFDKFGRDHKGHLNGGSVQKGTLGHEKLGGRGEKGGKVDGELFKDKGHKSRGFRNVYHKEEYGDHKTFHDDFNDSDFKKKYTDHHDFYDHNGAKFHKGYGGKNFHDEKKEGDDFHKFGKSGYDGQSTGQHKKGGHHVTVEGVQKQSGGAHQASDNAAGQHSKGHNVRYKDDYDGNYNNGVSQKKEYGQENRHSGFRGISQTANNGGHTAGLRGGYGQQGGIGHHGFYIRTPPRQALHQDVHQHHNNQHDVQQRHPAQQRYFPRQHLQPRIPQLTAVNQKSFPFF